MKPIFGSRGYVLYLSPNNIRYISLFFCSFRENKMSAVVIAYGVLWSNDRSLQSSKYESPILFLSLVCWYIFLRRHTHFLKAHHFFYIIILFFFFYQKVWSLPAVCHLLGYSIVLNFLDGGRLKGWGLLFLRLKGGIYIHKETHRQPPVTQTRRQPGLRILLQPGIDLVARFLHCLFFFWAKFSFFPKRFPFLYLTPFKVEQSSPVLTPHQQQPWFTRISFPCHQQRQIFFFK